jgi:hypothetical protein
MGSRSYHRYVEADTDQLVGDGRTAPLVEEDGVLVAAGETPVDDELVFALIDAGRK